MKLCKVILKNFRSYENQTFYINDLNVIIGKNDIGKSTILEALNIFFGEAKASKDDINKLNGSSEMSIECSFQVDGKKPIILDNSATSTLEDEYLINDEGYLSIKQTYSSTSPKSITINTDYPKIEDIDPLITMKIKELQGIVDQKNINMDGYKKSVKKDLRKCIFKHFGESLPKFRTEIEVLKAEKEVSNIYDQLKQEFPIFHLFTSDRKNTDQDPEVSNVLKAITKNAVSNVEQEFEKIKQTIRQEIENISNETLIKLKEFDAEISKELKSNLKDKELHSLFNFDFTSDDNIPFNNRGSGVKRLMLLSFFLADAERSHASTKNVIYAIEEPETSQHPNYQSMIIENLRELSIKDNRQVILTTHTPEIVKMVSTNNLIFIEKEDNSRKVSQVIDHENEVNIRGIIDTLGILPFIKSKNKVIVEGKTDQTFLENLVKTFPQLNDIFDLKSSTIIPTSGGGNVDNWVKNEYLDNTNATCIHFKDSDLREVTDISRKLITTERREIENYIPIDLINNYFNISIDPSSVESDDIPKMISNSIGPKYNKNGKKNEATIKEILQSQSIWKDINSENFPYQEAETWFKNMKIISDNNV